MSHVVSIQTQIRDRQAVLDACVRLDLPAPREETVTFYDRSRHTGLAVRLKGWDYPIVIDLPTGQVHGDDYGGKWGNPERLREFKQIYAVCAARIAARKQGHQVTEQRLADGSIRLTVNAGS